ncbi:MAG TPA: ATP-binding protein [Acidimicrobiia bacterium]
MTTPPLQVRVDATLQRIIVGFRLVSAVWITVLGIVGVVSWEADVRVVVGALAMVWAWTLLTFVALRAGWLESLLWLVVDLAVAMVVVALDAFDGATQGSFVGGFPTASVLLWGYTYRIPGGVGAGLAISAAIAVSESNLTGNITNSVLYIAVGGVAAWAFQVLRNSELGRLRAEAELEEERGARIRSEERAEVAAHLHDSVLQTLALIQKGSADASEVRHLARVQERELRAWLLGAREGGETMVGALEAACSEIERRLGVAVDLVAVGDRGLDDRLQAMVAAAAESVMNAAKHSGVETISVYAEAGGDPVQVYVRDRGVGFEPGAVGSDRRGLAESVMGRMERHGGSAEISSSPGSGTEVRLSMPVHRDGERVG